MPLAKTERMAGRRTKGRMETCPECRDEHLVYDPIRMSARCFGMDCDYKEAMTFADYSRRFEQEEGA